MNSLCETRHKHQRALSEDSIGSSWPKPIAISSFYPIKAMPEPPRLPSVRKLSDVSDISVISSFSEPSPFEPIPLESNAMECMPNSTSLYDCLLPLMQKTPTTSAMYEEELDEFDLDLFLDSEANEGFTIDIMDMLQNIDASSMEKDYTAPGMAAASSSTKEVEKDAPAKDVRLRTAHLEQWDQRFQEFIQFRKEHGHGLVPLQYAPNPQLSHWIKRQRCQYKLKREGKHSTLTDERLALLKDMGFIWDSHSASWESRFNELCDFKKDHGHCFVPALYPKNKQLAAWVKCQRRQLRAYHGVMDSPSVKCTLTSERAHKLLKLGLRFKKREAESKFRSAKKARNGN